MMKFIILAVLLFAVVANISAQTRRYPVFDRTCDARKAHFRGYAKSAFNTAAYSGTWFEVQRYQQQDEAEADCMSSLYSWGFITRAFRIDRQGTDFNSNAPFSRQATALIAHPDASPLMGMLNVTYYADREADETNYYVIATDYFQYSVGWACEDIEGNRSREYAWILSRTPDLPESYNARVTVLIDLHFDRELLRPTLQLEAYCLDRVMPGVNPESLV